MFLCCSISSKLEQNKTVDSPGLTFYSNCNKCLAAHPSKLPLCIMVIKIYHMSIDFSICNTMTQSSRQHLCVWMLHRRETELHIIIMQNDFLISLRITRSTDTVAVSKNEKSCGTVLCLSVSYLHDHDHLDYADRGATVNYDLTPKNKTIR